MHCWVEITTDTNSLHTWSRPGSFVQQRVLSPLKPLCNLPPPPPHFWPCTRLHGTYMPTITPHIQCVARDDLTTRWNLNQVTFFLPPLESSKHSVSCSVSPSSVSTFAGDRLSAILNSIQSAPFLSAAPSTSIFEQAAQPPSSSSSSSSSLVHSPFVFGQSPSQVSQPQLLSKSVLLSDSTCWHRCWLVSTWSLCSHILGHKQQAAHQITESL